MNLAWLGVIIPVAIAAGAALAQYLTSRRTGSGRISTSSAEALWTQTQAMLASEQRAKERAEDQRDKLMDIVEDKMMPALEAIAAGQKHTLGMLTELAGHIEKS